MNNENKILNKIVRDNFIEEEDADERKFTLEGRRFRELLKVKMVLKNGKKVEKELDVGHMDLKR